MKIPQGKPWLRHFHGLGDTPIEVDAVIRAPVFDAARLQQHAISLADSHHIGDDGIAHREVKAGLIANEASLAEIRDLLMRAVNNGETITPAGEWLVDNFHIAAQNTHQAIEDLPSGYFRELPKIRDGHLAFRPRVMAIAWAYIAHTDSRVEPERLANFVNAYQTVAHLTIGELWALAIQLRILLIENMARVARRTIESHNARAAAAQVAERFVAEEIDIAGIRLELEKCAEHARLSYFVELNRRIHGKRPINFADLADMMPQLGVDPADVTAAAHEEQARVVANNLTMQNIVTSLKAVGEIDWETWFRRVSVVDAILSRTGIYHQFDKQTRTLYRRSLEDLARYSGKTETEIARLAVEAAAPDDVGAVLIGGSRSIFEHQIAYRAPLHRLFGTVVKRAGLAGYLTASALLAFAIAAIAVAAHEASSFTAPGLLAFFLLILPLAFDAALAMVNYGITQLMRPVILPALDFENGVPDEHQTIIAMPVLITSFHGVDQSLERLEGHFISNPDANLFYAIVSDWMDAPSENMADDQSLLDRLKRGVEALNQKHGHDRIMVFHRARKWNASQKTWMGWERKRGKLHELNQLLRGAENTSFVSVPAQVPRGIRYVIVLDADTLLPRGAAAHLIGKIAHPLNQPVFDHTEGRVTRGYGILQPRVATLLPERNSGSIYHNLSVSRPGLDPYVFASSDVYQDLFGEGTFTGKGLYDIDAFEASVAGRVQENTLLSHDLFEGNFARAALASDVEVAEDFPERYLVDMARHHRWTRGDWQLLPWMFPPTRGLTALGWWKMFDNLRRSLMPALTFLSLVLGWGMLPAADAATWTTTVLTVLFMPAFLPVFAGSSMRREPITLSSEIHSFLDDLVHALRLTASRLTFLAHQASVMVDAIARTLYRLMVSRSHFLEWTTAAQLQTSLNPSLNGTYRLMWISAAAGLAVVLIGTVHGGALAIAGIPFGVLWMIAPAIAYFISTARRDESDAELTRDEIAELRQIALKTWRFFDVHVVERENMLPPDNLQEIPVPVIANRTSPTNIGLYMLSAVSAHEMGWIGLDEAANRLRATLDTVGRMRRFRGHLINWYDTQTLAPLEPQYVSTVDSGNLAAHLIAVANACDTWRLSSTTNTARLNGLVDLATALREIIGESISSHRDAKPAAAELTLEIDGLISTLNTLRDEPQFIALRLVSILAQIKRQTVLLRVLWEKVGFAGQANGLYWADGWIVPPKPCWRRQHAIGAVMLPFQRSLSRSPHSAGPLPMR